jgi:hypothetical protein
MSMFHEKAHRIDHSNALYLEPECQSFSSQDRSEDIYDIQELDVSASNIFDMWWSSKVQETDEF